MYRREEFVSCRTVLPIMQGCVISSTGHHLLQPIPGLFRFQWGFSVTRFDYNGA